MDDLEEGDKESQPEKENQPVPVNRERDELAKLIKEDMRWQRKAKCRQRMDRLF